jgi:hypothetical protein
MAVWFENNFDAIFTSILEIFGEDAARLLVMLTKV